MNCLFCNDKEKNYRPEVGIDFICSRCVIMLADADQNDLTRAHAEAMEKGYLNKARSIESFLIEDEIDVRKTKKSKRNMERKRPLRAVRSARNEVRA